MLKMQPHRAKKLQYLRAAINYLSSWLRFKEAATMDEIQVWYLLGDSKKPTISGAGWNWTLLCKSGGNSASWWMWCPCVPICCPSTIGNPPSMFGGAPHSGSTACTYFKSEGSCGIGCGRFANSALIPLSACLSVGLWRVYWLKC